MKCYSMRNLRKDYESGQLQKKAQENKKILEYNSVSSPVRCSTRQSNIMKNLDIDWQYQAQNNRIV